MLSSPIDEIKNRLDIVDVIGSYIKLHKAGVNYRAVCPFHAEKKPSFFVNPSRQIWHCFGSCGVGGDIFKFVMMIEGVEFGDALRILANKAGVELKREHAMPSDWNSQRHELYEITELACKFFEKQLESSVAGKDAKKYLLQRGLKEETIKSWRIGYAPDIWEGLTKFLIGKEYKAENIEKAGLCIKSEKTNGYYDRFRGRIMFPIFDLSSQPVAFGGRTLKKEETAKYVNSPATLLYDKSRILYGLNKAGMHIRKNDACVLVEGYMDALMVYQSGTENVVATSGTALTPYQLKILKRYSDNVHIAFDMDMAGNSATKRGIDLAQQEGFNIKIVTMPNSKDPAEAILENPDCFFGLITQAKSIHDFYFENAFLRFDRNTLEGKKEISKFLLPVIKKISNKIEQSAWVKDLAAAIDAKEEDVSEELSKVAVVREDIVPEQEMHGVPLFGLKTRKELIEERLISILVKFPENASLITQEDMKLFSLDAVRVIDYLQKGQSLNDEMNNRISHLSFKMELEESDIDPKAEFACSFRELKSLVVKDKLTEICKSIREAEQEKNSEKVKELVQQFCHYSKSKNDLEAQTL